MALTAILVKLGTAGYSQVLGPMTAREARGFSGDLLLLEQKPLTAEDMADYRLFLECLKGSPQPRVALLQSKR